VIHILKLRSAYFNDVGHPKTWELRKTDDRTFALGDWCLFLEVDDKGSPCTSESGLVRAVFFQICRVDTAETLNAVVYALAAGVALLALDRATGKHLEVSLDVVEALLRMKELSGDRSTDQILILLNALQELSCTGEPKEVSQ